MTIRIEETGAPFTDPRDNTHRELLARLKEIQRSRDKRRQHVLEYRRNLTIAMSDYRQLLVEEQALKSAIMAYDHTAYASINSPNQVDVMIREMDSEIDMRKEAPQIPGVTGEVSLSSQ